MAQLQQLFDASAVDPTMGGSGFPVGKHKFIIHASEIKENKTKDGGYLQLDATIIEGPLQGSTGVLDRLNLYHSNPQTVEIAYKRLSAYCHILGQLKVADSNQLHNIPFYAEIGLQKGEDAAAKGYTEIKKLYDINGNEPGKQGQPQSTQPTQATNTGGWNGGGNQQQPQQNQQPVNTGWNAGQVQQPTQNVQQPTTNGGWNQNQPQQNQQPNQTPNNAGGATTGFNPNNPPWGQKK